jgi:hypothetical protein
VFSTLAALAESPSIRRRVVACAALEGVIDPVRFANENAWYIPDAGWVEAVEYAQSNKDYEGDPFDDPTVITDVMILSAVQHRLGKHPEATG